MRPHTSGELVNVRSSGPPQAASRPDPSTVSGLALDLLLHPFYYLVTRWNWKSAVTSALVRGAIFFTVNLRAGMRAAVGALLAEFVYRTLLSGSVGSLTQAFRRCEPPCAAALAAMVALPLFSHAVEFTVHYLRGTPALKAGVLTSISFTVISTLFNLYAMRRGVMVVGPGAHSLAQDFKRMPMILAGFLAVLPLALLRAVRSITSSR